MPDFNHIGPILDRERQRLWDDTPTLGLQSLWERAVGEEIAENTAVRSLRSGVMTVGCASGGWACELKLSSGDIIPRINQLDPPEKVTEIRFIPHGGER